MRAHLAMYESKRDLVSLGVYKAGSDPKLDAALQRIDRIESFLKQSREESTTLDETIQALIALQ